VQIIAKIWRVLPKAIKKIGWIVKSPMIEKERRIIRMRFGLA